MLIRVIRGSRTVVRRRLCHAVSGHLGIRAVPFAHSADCFLAKRNIKA
jgi:hypothetical protein